jgi:hypothetical protein
MSYCCDPMHTPKDSLGILPGEDKEYTCPACGMKWYLTCTCTSVPPDANVVNIDKTFTMSKAPTPELVAAYEMYSRAWVRVRGNDMVRLDRLSDFDCTFILALCVAAKEVTCA